MTNPQPNRIENSGHSEGIRKARALVVSLKEALLVVLPGYPAEAGHDVGGEVSGKGVVLPSLRVQTLFLVAYAVGAGNDMWGLDVLQTPYPPQNGNRWNRCPLPCPLQSKIQNPPPPHPCFTMQTVMIFVSSSNVEDASSKRYPSGLSHAWSRSASSTDSRTM